MKKGFTLVELSIVLVVIGLLIGGILVAQSMVSTARVTMYIENLHQYQIAVSNFRLNYKGEPGDSPLFTPPGDGSGYFEGLGGCISGNYTENETTYAWAHLTQSGMLKGNYVAWTPITCGGTQDADYMNTVGVTAPSFGESSLLKIIDPSIKTKKVMIWYLVNDQLQKYFETFAAPVDTIALDTKMDDGVSTSGNFRAQAYGNGNCDDYIRNGGNPNTAICFFDWYPDEAPD